MSRHDPSAKAKNTTTALSANGTNKQYPNTANTLMVSNGCPILSHFGNPRFSWK